MFINAKLLNQHAILHSSRNKLLIHVCIADVIVLIISLIKAILNSWDRALEKACCYQGDCDF